MAREKPVLEHQEIEYEPVSEFELDTGVAYAKREYEKDIDRDLLRILVNTMMRRREPKSILPFLAGVVVRKGVPLSNKEEAPKRDAYKGGMMKICSDRSAAKRKADALKRKQGRHVPPRPKPTEHPEDPNRKGQLMLL